MIMINSTNSYTITHISCTHRCGFKSRQDRLCEEDIWLVYGMSVVIFRSPLVPEIMLRGAS